MIEDSPNLREIAFQKYRDGDLGSTETEFIWDVDTGRIEENHDSLL
jgi:hypothetical protein